MPRSVEPSMTVRDVAELLSVDIKTTYWFAQKGDPLEGFKVPRSLRFQRPDLVAWIGRRKLIAKKKGIHGVTKWASGAPCK